MKISDYAKAQGWLKRHASSENSAGEWEKYVALNTTPELDIAIKTINDKYGPGTVFPASEAPIPEMTDTQRIMEFNERNPYSDGQLVTPSGDGSRPGYAGTKVEDNIRLRDNGNAYDVEIQRGPQTFRKSFNLKDYKNKTEALNAAKKYKAEKIKIPFKTGKQDPMFGSGLDKKEYQKLYHAKTRTLTEAGELAKERDLKLKNFIGNKKKINASTLRDFVIDELGYDNYSAGRIKQKFPNLEIIKDIKPGTKFTPLTKKQIELVKDNFDLPEGVEKWNFKQYKNGISADKYPNLFAQIKRRLDDKTIYKVAANFSDPQGWMMSAMNRLYENETILKDGKRVLKEGVDKLTYEPIKNKKGIIVGFKDNTAAGKNNIYYGTKKAEKNYGDGTDWRIHGNFNRVDKFLKIANGVKAEPDKLLQKILDKKGITQILKGKGYLTLNDVLSHQRYYSKLSETSPRALIKRQIVLHHTGGVGDQNLARAAATKDIQLLTDAVNSNVIKLENIVKGTSTTPGRKLTIKEKAQLKDWGAKIVDFDGKVVGGGFLDPDRQFAAIEKDALKYAKGKDFNVKTVTSYLERLLGPEWCGKADGGRIGFSKGSGCPIDVRMKNFQEANDRVRLGEGTMDDAAKIRKTNIKGVKTAGSLKALLGIWGLGGEALIEGAFAANEMMKGKSGREAWSESYASWLDPTMYEGGIKLSGQDVAMRELDLNTGEQLALKLDNQSKQLMKLIETQEFSDAEFNTGFGEGNINVDYSDQIAALKQEMEATKAQLAKHGGMEANTQSIQVKLDDYRDKQATTAFTKPYRTNLVTYDQDGNKIQRSRAGKNTFVNREIVGRELFDQDAIPKLLVPDERLNIDQKKDVLGKMRKDPDINEAFWKIQMGQDSPVKGNIYGASDTFFGETYDSSNYKPSNRFKNYKMGMFSNGGIASLRRKK